MNRKELEAHLREGRAKLAEQRHKRQSDRDKLRAENDTRVRELRADNERLRAALREAARRMIANGDGFGASEAVAALEHEP
jgi:23S rRNA A2030 N6-methylase RlmJ